MTISSTWSEFVSSAGNDDEIDTSYSSAVCQENIHWRDPALAYTVYLDMRNNELYKHVRGACFPISLYSDYRIWIVRAHRLLRDESKYSLSAVISVSAGFNVEPGQLSDISEKAKKWLESSRTIDEIDLPLTIMIAFCDGTKIVYYNAFEGIEDNENISDLSSFHQLKSLRT
mmetsp:Transcript_15536/g.23144  ORF Transcript_15536/g.23144 Transcript_15536/m.23144 type:complete len:172 (-) Transcript_15536:147-662(-)|eukprot:CAMPEP_0171454352 /NCGR_PEP_ID=MMETSP0945-20130129/1671_1 /TAXON_ID=109269 /ORGANISM="Vaucheria litorea, Strain CCMP2940" /LENGTH=171 /DNA_ID=CAMNT_0011979355 /DNA_START=57 /DNA_END=572 /DNA_ORIENTATION=-